MDKNCLQCHKPIKGRSDKVFCDSYCRNSYNNKAFRENEKLMLGVNKVLRKNRRILKTVNPQGKSTIRKDYLDTLGFDFRYFTHVFKSGSGNIYRFCYDFGYMPVDLEKILVINWQSYMNKDFEKDTSVIFD